MSINNEPFKDLSPDVFKIAVIKNTNLSDKNEDNLMILLRPFKTIEEHFLRAAKPYLEASTKKIVTLENWRVLADEHNIQLRCLSIHGHLETGKSYNLSKFIQYLRTKYPNKWNKYNDIDIFPDASKSERNTFADNGGKTRGIDAFVSFDSLENGKFLTLILDSEGNGANVSPRYDGLVNALLYLLSDVIIFNSLEKHDITHIINMMREMSYLEETIIELHEECTEKVHIQKPTLLCLYNGIIDSSDDPIVAAQITADKWNDQISKCIKGPYICINRKCIEQ
jgi:hypothetical protein